MPALADPKPDEVSACPGVQNLRHQVEPFVLDGRGVVQYVGLHGAPCCLLGRLFRFQHPRPTRQPVADQADGCKQP
jgi:hypothetical protein